MFLHVFTFILQYSSLIDERFSRDARNVHSNVHSGNSRCELKRRFKEVGFNLPAIIWPAKLEVEKYFAKNKIFLQFFETFLSG